MTSTRPDPSPDESPLILDAQGQPRSRLYGDVYFSTEDGLAESRAVFLQGCGLPERWAERRDFTVAELGFGTGLNILALLDLWRRTRPAAGRLHIFTIEAHPIEAHAAAQALSAWPELAALQERLLGRWPGRRRGFHRVDLADLHACLDVAVMEAGPALAGWSGQADAWFLDGFSPAVNPQMWRGEVLEKVAARTAPGGRLATFTVAGAVRRGLQEAGLEVAKRPGHGRKRERLEAWRSDSPAATEAPRPRVAVIGAGIAGAAMARALRALDVDVQVFDAQGAGAGASGNPAALVTPRLDAALGALAGLFAQALDRANALYGEVPGAILSRGVLQLAQQSRDPERFAKIAAADLFEPGALTLHDAMQSTAWAGEPAGTGLMQHAACVVRPSAVLEAWLGPVSIADLGEIEATDGGWALTTTDGAVCWQGEAVVVCAGHGAVRLVESLPLQAVRGQISVAADLTSSGVAWGGYAAPSPEGLVFGATHDREDTDSGLRPGDHQRNLETLATALPDLAAQVHAASLSGRASVRAVTPDRLPLAGGMGNGVYVLGGLGSRGFCLAPLLAEHVAAAITGVPSPLPADMAALVDPDRFRQRALRRAGGRPE
ncbi:MAG: FAD-dependent 5-carboxymethylaminomethyl-2-thiouridine(34) oxidoreductase MnmC [Phenylobacterium sp.]|uniref:FAD-dependent 5-carboxymethylaminomethyl-2-thiouridine(34) oxidoreductase MnmC n=1 Tax=Phenylobacterium sp. TaxID=1871053 RepID=UPI0027251612|nr:FAD-dependent 5-carboxymethylaminomethyl-2-thiouridine(34) oxidoreductase MnmC [Phenylobacterium sp.]MDO8902486.1 FAD-dependent 5-carboxymethylaminomethyl-2-thiouridine(34) oxidoreductase MnmC [Phenylobacterium sp.]